MYLKSIDVEAVSLNASSSKVMTNKHFLHIIDTLLVLIMIIAVGFMFDLTSAMYLRNMLKWS